MYFHLKNGLDSRRELHSLLRRIDVRGNADN